jgi:hypothetical protein
VDFSLNFSPFSCLVPLPGVFPLFIYLSILFVVLRSPSSHAVALGLKRRPTFIHEVGVTDHNADAKEKISSLRSSFSFARREGGRGGRRRCEERNRDGKGVLRNPNRCSKRERERERERERSCREAGEDLED